MVHHAGPLMALVVAALTLLAGTAAADHPTVGFGSDQVGPIVTVSATPLGKGRWAVGARSEYVKFDDFGDGELAALAASGEEVHSTDDLLAVFVGVGYGVTDDLTLSARIPYVRRTDIREGHLEDGEPEAHEHGDSDGVGDLTLFGQYRFFSANDWDAALLAGLKTPTGETDEKDDDDERFETEHQPGSGSWDPMLGVAVTRRWGRICLDANVLYAFTTEGSQDTTLGDILNYNFAVSTRLNAERKHDHADHVAEHSHSHLLWDLILELNGEWHDRDKVERVSDRNSGGTLIYLSPGVRLTVHERFAGYMSVGVPIHEASRGEQHDTEYRVILGLSASF